MSAKMSSRRRRFGAPGSEKDRVRRTLNEAWVRFWSAPPAFAAWEKEVAQALEGQSRGQSTIPDGILVYTLISRWLFPISVSVLLAGLHSPE